jgi:hypothetical protein
MDFFDNVLNNRESYRRKKVYWETRICAFVAAWYFQRSFFKKNRAEPHFMQLIEIREFPLFVQLKLFRFSIPEISYLAQLLRIPDYI